MKSDQSFKMNQGHVKLCLSQHKDIKAEISPEPFHCSENVMQRGLRVETRRPHDSGLDNNPVC